MTSREETPPGAAPLLRRLATVAAVGLGAYVLFSLRSLIGPVLVGGLLAYICRPLVTRLERLRLYRGAAIAFLLVAMTLVAAVVVNGTRNLAPSDDDALELRVRALFKLTAQYEAVMGLGRPGGNRLYQVVHSELDPVLGQLASALALTPEEHAQFLAQLSSRRHDNEATRQLLAYDRAIMEALRKRAQDADLERTADLPAQRAATSSSPARGGPAKHGVLGDILSSWAIAPLVFFFLLRDTGEIKRGLLAMLPSRLFEPALTVVADLDRALGDYVRGVSLECGVLGLTVGLLLTVVGVPLHWAITIGIVSGASNMVPYVGSAVALLSGLGYALLAEDVRPLLPWVNRQNLALWVVLAVALAELLKSVIYEPVVLGGQVKLHPLVMGIGAFGGATLFGPVGMFLAIPTITIVKVFVSSSARQLKAYGLI